MEEKRLKLLTGIDSTPLADLAVIGKAVVSGSAQKDSVFNSLKWRIEGEPSVQMWSYKSLKSHVEVKIYFVDEETVLDIKVNPRSISDLQSALETIENYMVAKRARS